MSLLSVTDARPFEESASRAIETALLRLCQLFIGKANFGVRNYRLCHLKSWGKLDFLMACASGDIRRRTSTMEEELR
jgi:hypothetical protein